MAYNSDGYIMIDFSMVDFRKTNQTIDGLFERCKNVIGTNKFVIVINANNKTPLPSTVSITNGQYVIESVLYTFSISSVDNLHITKKTTPEELIDDDHITLKTTWSSSKIDDEINGKQDTLTPISPIAIDADNNISFNVKSFTYTGDGTTSFVIQFPELPHVILCVYGTPDSTRDTAVMNYIWGLPRCACFSLYTNQEISSTYRSVICNVNSTSYRWRLTTTGSPIDICNKLDYEYTVYYI